MAKSTPQWFNVADEGWFIVSGEGGSMLVAIDMTRLENLLLLPPKNILWTLPNRVGPSSIPIAGGKHPWIL